MKRVALMMVGLALSTGCGNKLKKLQSYEVDHYNALKVYMDKDAEKGFFKLKTSEERDQYLKDRGLWERFYKYDEERREDILSGQVREGFTEDQVFMAWGAPHDRKRLTGRPATRSELFRYRFEVQPDGEILVWRRGSKTEYKAVDFFQYDLYVDDSTVTEMVKTDDWVD